MGIEMAVLQSPRMGIKGLFRNIYFRLFKPRSFQHNRRFHPSLDIVRETPTTFSVLWEGRPIARAKTPAAITAGAGACNIIGSGPSINSIRNPRLLFNAKTICVNGSFNIACRVGARPDYYMVSDRGFIFRNFEFFRSAATTSREVVLSASGINTICRVDPSLLKAIQIIYYQDLRRPFKSNSLKEAEDRKCGKFAELLINHSVDNVAFSKDLSLGIFPSGTVIYDAIQFACGIGFTELYIFGMDLTDSGRFYHEEVPEKSLLRKSYTSEIRPGFEIVKKYADERGLFIYNCSPDSRLPGRLMAKVDPNTVLEWGAGRLSRTER